MVIAEALAEASPQVLALLAHVGEQVAATDLVLYSQCAGAGEGMAEIGMAMLEETRAARKRVDDGVAHEDGANWRKTTAQPFGDCHQIGSDTLLLAGMQRARASHSAHDLVKDQ